MSLIQLATDEVVTGTPESGVSDALDMMDENGVGSVVIVEDDEPVGIVTDRMIAMALRDAESIDGVTVADVMSEDLVTIGQDATHLEAVQTMNDEAIRRVPIVDDSGSLAGIITLDDIITITASELSNAADVIAQQAKPL